MSASLKRNLQRTLCRTLMAIMALVCGAVRAVDVCNLQPWEPLPAPVRTNGVIAEIDLDQDSLTDIAFHVESDDIGTTAYVLDYFERREAVAALSATSTWVGFEMGALVGLPDQKVYVPSNPPPARVLLLVNTWVDRCDTTSH